MSHRIPLLKDAIKIEHAMYNVCVDIASFFTIILKYKELFILVPEEPPLRVMFVLLNKPEKRHPP